MTLSFDLSPGKATPLGTSYESDGVNFAIYSHHATAVSLCLFPPSATTPVEIPLHPRKNRTGDIWHIFIKNLPPNYRYGYRVDGPYEPELGHTFDNRSILLDPYAKWLDAPTKWKQKKRRPYLAFVGPQPDFDWGNDLPPSIHFKDLIIYEMHVRGFTVDRSSQTNHPGTYLGVIEKIPYLKKLGVNAIELLPIHEFMEWDTPFIHPETGEALSNFWGYSTVSYFAPMRRYGTIPQFKEMVKALHKVGIEVILDVVYNHTAEGDHRGKTLHFRGLENSVYYMTTQPGGLYYNYSGCGNTVNCNHPVVRSLIRDSLRYWVEEMHVDGFRFDLASIFSRGHDGTPLSNPPIIEELARDPVLGKTKLIAEAWDAAGLYQVGSFPHHNKWSEWNGKYRDQVRRFVKGTDGESGHFSTRLCGSEDLYGGRAPFASINFITSHDGFSLRDLVSYNGKHNLANGENNNDGDNNNESWNCGYEGVTSDPKVLVIRKRQIKNFLITLFLSQGVPMLLMGDEYGHSKLGNNNTWGQDNRLNWFQWDTLQKEEEVFDFCRQMIELRRIYPILRRSNFFKKRDVIFHGITPKKPDWGLHNRFIACSLTDRLSKYSLYFAFNAHYIATTIELPKLPTGKWELLIDTALATQPTSPESLAAYEKRMPPHSALLLVAKTPYE